MGQVFTAVTAGQGNGVGLSLYTFGRLNFFSCRVCPRPPSRSPPFASNNKQKGRREDHLTSVRGKEAAVNNLEQILAKSGLNPDESSKWRLPDLNGNNDQGIRLRGKK